MKRRTTVCSLSALTALTAGLLTLGGAPAQADDASLAGRTSVRIGMSTPAGEWGASLNSTGSVDGRRLFDDLTSPDFALATARAEILAGRLPVLSFKVPGNDWAGVAAGHYDGALAALRDRLAVLPGRVFVTLHHEPASDGSAADWAAMQRHALPILSPPANVEAGVIANGFWWSQGPQGLTDAEIAQWLPADVLRLAEVVAADTYQGGTSARPGEDAGVKIRGLSAWANRTGVSRLGIGEYNGLSGAALRAAGSAVLADPRFDFALCYNSSENNRAGVNWKLEGDRLAAFQETVRASRAARGVATSPPPVAAPAARDASLPGGTVLDQGSTVRSPSGTYRFVLQSDGNAVVYDRSNRASWNSRTFLPGSTFAMQGDGNAVVYSAGRALWNSGSDGAPGARLDMQDDGNLVVYRADNRPTWNSLAAG